MKKALISIQLILISWHIYAQEIPIPEANIEFLVVTGDRVNSDFTQKAKSQEIFFVIPIDYKGLASIRIFDADIGNQNDIKINAYDTQVKYQVFGGEAANWNKNDSVADPLPLAEKLLGVSELYDNKWMTLADVNPQQGYYCEQFNAYILKLVVSGYGGDDFNSFRVYLSISSTKNLPIEGSDSFTFKRTCILNSDTANYDFPYIEKYYSNIKINLWGWNTFGNLVVEHYNFDTEIHKFNSTGKNSFITSPIEEDVKRSLIIQFVNTYSAKRTRQIICYEILDDKFNPLMIYSTPIGIMPRYRPIEKN